MELQYNNPQDDPRLVTYAGSCSRDFDEKGIDVDFPCYICEMADECLHYLFTINEYKDPEEVLKDDSTNIIEVYLEYLYERLRFRHVNRDTIEKKINILEKVIKSR